jgi:hypothetical protein
VPEEGTGGTVAVVADDLIWASRLVEAVRRAGGTPVRLSNARELGLALEAASLAERDPPGPTASGPTPPGPTPSGPAPSRPTPSAAVPARLVGGVVDLFGHRYDGRDAVAAIHAADLPVIAVAQHDDLETRRAALDAGALRVFSYAKFFAEGPRLVADWLVRSAGR